MADATTSSKRRPKADTPSDHDEPCDLQERKRQEEESDE